ncbi:very short patch repair endonuclease [Kaistia sp. 32K]|uniref:very short patch repair endonuclease n=1 Tax=Kaistia sp. 32K TaxID=2795690 RepID=UPI0019156DE4|nr:very short patch repair endonuclease [Kaistia sp. 32K]
MRRVRQNGTSAELAVGRVLRSMRSAYRLNVKSLPGSPDFANRGRSWAIFVNGCFWHHHTGCKRGSIPKTNTDFWIEKFSGNRRRDADAIVKLRAMGIRVAVIWECETADEARIKLRLSKLFEPRSVNVP